MKHARLTLDFAPHARRMSWVGAAALLASVVLLAGATYRLAGVLAATAHDADALAQIEARRLHASAPRTRPLEPGEVVRIRAARQVAQTLMTPWGELLESLEAAPKQTVALLSVEPSVAKHSLRLSAEARNTQDMIDYLDALQHDERLSDVVLVSHQVQQAPGSPVRFQIQANWGQQP